MNVVDLAGTQVAFTNATFVHGIGPLSGIGWYRVELPVRWLVSRGHSASVVDVRATPGRHRGSVPRVPITSLRAGSTLVLQREDEMPGGLRLSALRARGVRVVYEVDDDMWGLPQWHPTRAKSAPRQWDGHLARMLDLARSCDAVTTTTRALADRLEGMGVGCPVHLVQNGIPLDLVPPHSPGRPRRGFRVGWWGSTNHEGDLAVAAPGLKAFLAKCPSATLVFMGSCPAGFRPNLRVEVHRGVPPQEFYSALRRLDLDALAAPLDDCEFNRSKSNVKLLEAGALGLPVVASDVGPYRTLPPAAGILVAGGGAGDWSGALGALAGSSELRGRMGAAGRAWVEGAHTMDHSGPLWVKALSR